MTTGSIGHPVIDIRSWVLQAERIQEGDGYTYAGLARALVDALGWAAAADMACAVRGHVYGWHGGHALHRDVKPLYDALGWQQSALITSWFRDARNRPNNQPKKRAAGWPTARPAPRTTHTKEPPCPT
ncbi:hypothetical protein [Streptomyces mirabilis]|uniref:hypothetical protein n=1 Tax=Streptomyces mirabilis TaxID=68239 RepID=UPI003686FA2C